jgi:c-di-GMP-binding flagellar brake protein YcgR
MEEQRKNKYHRASRIGLAEVRRKSTGSKTQALTVNISDGGMGFYVREPLSGEVEVKLFFTGKNGRQVIETLMGRTVWQKPVGSWYAVGIEFSNLDPQKHPNTVLFLEQSESLLHRHSFDA